MTDDYPGLDRGPAVGFFWETGINPSEQVLEDVAEPETNCCATNTSSCIKSRALNDAIAIDDAIDNN